jgi:hypothetical protein
MTPSDGAAPQPDEPLLPTPLGQTAFDLGIGPGTSGHFDPQTTPPQAGSYAASWSADVHGDGSLWAAGWPDEQDELDYGEHPLLGTPPAEHIPGIVEELPGDWV